MARLVAFVAVALLASAAAAQHHAPPASAPPASPAPAPAAQQPGAAPAQPAPKGGNAKVVDEAKVIGKKGLLKVAPRLGKAEKVVTKQGGNVLDQAIDLLADKAGFAPVKTAPAPASPAAQQPPPAAPAAPRR